MTFSERRQRRYFGAMLPGIASAYRLEIPKTRLKALQSRDDML